MVNLDFQKTHGSDKVTLQVFDTFGNLVYPTALFHETALHESINLTGLTSGIYWFVVSTDENILLRQTMIKKQ
jgi:hypothetical protein